MAERFGWIGASRREALSTGLLEAIQAWSRDWVMTPCEWLPITDTDANISVPEEGLGTTSLVVATGPGPLGFLTGLDDRRGAGGLAKHLEEEALHALFASIDGRPSVKPELTATKTLSGPLVRPELGAVRLGWRAGEFQIDLWFAREAIDRLAPPLAARSERLVPRNGALDHAVVALRTELDLGSIPLADIRYLRPGDVIATSTPLDALFDVVEQEKGRALFTASLGARGSHRAVRIVESRG